MSELPLGAGKAASAHLAPIVFIIDDDAAVRDSLAWLLDAAEFTVRTFDSAHDFLDAYEPGIPGCVLVDMRMPGMSGLDFLRELEARNIHLPVLVITGHGDTRMTADAIAHGAIGLLEKPIDDEVLLDVIRNALKSADAA